MSLHPCFRRRWLLQVCSGKAFPRKHAFVDISVFLCLRKQRPRFAQGQPKKVIFKPKNFIERLKLLLEMNADWKVEKAQYAEFNVPTCGKIAVCQLCRAKTGFVEHVMMAWIWHVWINAMVFVPMAQAPPKAGAKRIVIQVYSLNLIHEFTSLFSPKVIVAGLPWESLPTEACLCGHQC